MGLMLVLATVMCKPRLLLTGLVRHEHGHSPQRRHIQIFEFKSSPNERLWILRSKSEQLR